MAYLVLTRRTGQTIVIGEDIVVTVLEVRGGRVKLGITAPSDVNIMREFLGEHETPRQEGGTP